VAPLPPHFAAAQTRVIEQPFKVIINIFGYYPVLDQLVKLLITKGFDGDLDL